MSLERKTDYYKTKEESCNGPKMIFALLSGSKRRYFPNPRLLLLRIILLF
uniref:Uncharacterized protein n=1 Tax=Anguilla anguilla TaxID=7936 RepID=A0A0E9TXR0_ANGAN